MKRIEGYWVVFEQPDVEGGPIPRGFYIDAKRAKDFHREPGWMKNHLEAVYRSGRRGGPRKGT